MGYWAERIDEQNTRLYDKTLIQAEVELARQYQRAQKDIQRDILDLYDKIMIDSKNGKLTPNSLYRYNRYFQLMNGINRKLTSLGASEIKVCDKTLLKMYNEVQNVITNNSIPTISNSYVPTGKAEEVLKSIWCADGKHWSERVWNNKKALQEAIEKGLMDCVVRGMPRAEFAKSLADTFNVGFNMADRLVRTELAFVQNQACADRYTAAGVKEYEILAVQDRRTSKVCREQDGKIYRFDMMKVGENYPPFHPNCRTTIIPVLGD